MKAEIEPFLLPKAWFLFRRCLCVFMSFLVIPDHFLIEFSGLYGVSPRWLDEQFNTLMYIQTLLENQEINLVTSWVRQIGLQVNESVIFSVQDIDILVFLQLLLFNPHKGRFVNSKSYGQSTKHQDLSWNSVGCPKWLEGMNPGDPFF